MSFKCYCFFKNLVNLILTVSDDFSDNSGTYMYKASVCTCSTLDSIKDKVHVTWYSAFVIKYPLHLNIAVRKIYSSFSCFHLDYIYIENITLVSRITANTWKLVLSYCVQIYNIVLILIVKILVWKFG